MALVTVTDATFQNDADGLRMRYTASVEQAFRGQFAATVAFAMPIEGTKESLSIDPTYPTIREGERGVVLLEAGDNGAALLVRQPVAWRPVTAVVLATCKALSSSPASFPAAPVPAAGSRVAASVKNAATNFDDLPFVTTNSRFRNDRPVRSRLPEEGKPIPVVYDASTRPAGISRKEALQALKDALASWEASSHLRFAIIGEETFGRAASDFDEDRDGTIRIAFGDPFNQIQIGEDDQGNPVESFLGRGAARSTGFDNLPFDGARGGVLNGLVFNEIVSGWVIMNHRAPGNQNLAKFTSVLTHEIGHTLGLAHSSEREDEPDGELREATMYFLISDDERGAALKKWDKDSIQVAAPPDEFPPYRILSRDVEIVTFFPENAPDDPRVNRFAFPPVDADGDPVTIAAIDDNQLVGPTALLSDIIVEGSRLTLVPRTGFTPQTAPEGSSYGRAQLFLTDGKGNYAFSQVSVQALCLDNTAPFDGLPDDWVASFLDEEAPAPESGIGPDDDFDGDGYTNFVEFRRGKDPTVVDPPFTFTADPDTGSLSYTAKPGEIILLQGFFKLGGEPVPRAFAQSGETIRVPLDEPVEGVEFFNLLLVD